MIQLFCTFFQSLCHSSSFQQTLINELDLRQNITITDMLEAMEQALLIQAEGNYVLPDRLSFPQKKGAYVLMPCFSEKYISNKLLTTYPENNLQGKRTINGILILSNMVTGEPLALINGTYLTAIRTGALGGISCKYLAPQNSERIGVIGCGTQGLYQTLSAAAVRPVRDVYAFDINSSILATFPERVAKYRADLRVHTVKTPRIAAEAAQILITCTTSPEPVLPDEPSLFAGRHIVAIGTYEPFKRELPPSAIKTADEVCTDTIFACKESGDLAISLAHGLIKQDAVTEFAFKVKAGLPEPFARSETTMFKSVGMGLYDLVAAGMIYQKSVREKIGLHVEI